jgi:hypothetical protein
MAAAKTTAVAAATTMTAGVAAMAAAAAAMVMAATRYKGSMRGTNKHGMDGSGWLFVPCSPPPPPPYHFLNFFYYLNIFTYFLCTYNTVFRTF